MPLGGKYYTNPFHGAEDDVCYAEIICDEDREDPPRPSMESGEWYPSGATRGEFAGAGENSNTALSHHHQSTVIPLSAIHGGDDATPRLQALSADFTDQIAQLREELEHTYAENNRLTAAQAKLESRIRSLTFEKENAESLVHQEVERNRILTEQIADLRTELDQTFERANARKTFSASEPMASNAQPGNQHRGSHISMSTFGSARLNHGTGDELEVVEMELQPADVTHQNSSLLERQRLRQSLSSQVSYHPVDPAASANAIREVAPQGGSAHLPPRQPNPSAVAPPKNQKLDAAALKQLENDLLAYNQKCSDLSNQLHRMQSMRVRSVAERKQKMTVERELEEVEKVIGKIRLQLRSQGSLIR